MAKKKVKAEETKVMLPEEVIVSDTITDEEPMDVVVEQDSLLEAEIGVEENKQEVVSVDTVEEENKQEDISAETVECNSLGTVDVEVSTVEGRSDNENIKVDTEEERLDYNEGLTDSFENKENIPTVPTMVFRSASEEARYYILEMLKDGESHKKSEIVAYITERAGKTYSDAIVINVLRGMINSGSLISLERGTYSIGSGIGLVSKLISFIEVTRKNLDKLSTVSVSDITESDLSAIEEVKLLKETMETIYERLVTN